MGDRRGGDRQKEDRRAEVDPRGYAKPEEYGGYTYAPNATNPRPTKLKLKTHWIPGEGIDREVLQGEVQRFLGPEATCAPQVHEVRFIHPLEIHLIRNREEMDTRLQLSGHSLP